MIEAAQRSQERSVMEVALKENEGSITETTTVPLQGVTITSTRPRRDIIE